MTLNSVTDGGVSEESEDHNHHVVVRAFADHTPKWQRFQTATTTVPSASNKIEQNFPFQRQYAHVYHQRLASLKPRCWESVERDAVLEGNSTTPPPIRVARILELREDVPSHVVGTLVKECGSPQEKCIWVNKKCRASDYLVLEDESGRVTLDFASTFNATVHQYCTGLVVGVRGVVGTNGVMKVDKLYSPVAVAHPPIDEQVRMERGAQVLLLSGLQLGDPSSSSLARDMLLSYLDGMLQSHSAAKICRVVIAGGSIAAGSTSESTGNQSTFHAHHSGGLSSSTTTASTAPRSIQELDAFCAQILAMGIPVDLIPGQDDPTTATWPQRPLHSSLFPFSRAVSAAAVATTNFYQTPNPYAAVWGNRFVVGTDGTNVSDLIQSANFSSDEAMIVAGTQGDDLMALAKTLEWGHICPTGPDSVPTMPHAESDPLVIRETPHLYFMGNAEFFSCKLFTTVDHERKDNQGPATKSRLVCVPKFGQTGEAVLVCLETLEVQILRFVATRNN
jgi:DNA polymerase delta subunit 2